MPNSEFAASDPRHGTRAGYELHSRRKEPKCEACAEANRERNRRQRAAYAKQRFDPHRAYIVEEVEFLAGTDGPDSIATRLGYAEFDNLKIALRRWRRSDLIDRLVSM